MKLNQPVASGRFAGYVGESKPFKSILPVGNESVRRYSLRGATALPVEYDGGSTDKARTMGVLTRWGKV